jgi:hypothetical protein
VQVTVRPNDEITGFFSRVLNDRSLDYYFGGCVLTTKPHC